MIARTLSRRTIRVAWRLHALDVELDLVDAGVGPGGQLEQIGEPGVERDMDLEIVHLERDLARPTDRGCRAGRRAGRCPASTCMASARILARALRRAAAVLGLAAGDGGERRSRRRPRERTRDAYILPVDGRATLLGRAGFASGLDFAAWLADPASAWTSTVTFAKLGRALRRAASTFDLDPVAGVGPARTSSLVSPFCSIRTDFARGAEIELDVGRRSSGGLKQQEGRSSSGHQHGP